MADYTPSTRTESSGPRIIFSPKLVDILTKLEYNDSYLAFELLWMSEPGSKYFNGLKITHVDVGPPNKRKKTRRDNSPPLSTYARDFTNPYYSPGRTYYGQSGGFTGSGSDSSYSESDFSFLVTIAGKKHYMKIGKFIRYFFPKLYTDFQILGFSSDFNKLKNGEGIEQVGTRIEKKKYPLDHQDVRSTFLSLVSKTYPHGHEDEVIEFMPDVKKDKYGNYYKIVHGDKTTMFTCHLDTADRTQKTTNLYTKQEDGDEIIYTDGDSILGADDKAGAAVMLYMIANKVPGLYYFFIGEERGGIGSNQVSLDFAIIDYVSEIKKCISFDRRKTISVITHQMGKTCCSNVFGTALCKEYNSQGLNLSLDSGGIYTDSASFIDDIPECTNLSVGYENEHTGRELQNMSFLVKLAEASLKVDWKKLPVVRRVGLNYEVVRKHKKLIEYIKGTAFNLDVKMVGWEDKVYIKIDLDDNDIDVIYDELDAIQNILNKYKVDSMALFSDTYIKIELK